MQYEEPQPRMRGQMLTQRVGRYDLRKKEDRLT